MCPRNAFGIFWQMMYLYWKLCLVCRIEYGETRIGTRSSDALRKVRGDILEPVEGRPQGLSNTTVRHIGVLTGITCRHLKIGKQPKDEIAGSIAIEALAEMGPKLFGMILKLAFRRGQELLFYS